MPRERRYTERVQITLPVETVAQIKRCASELGMSRSEFLRHFSSWVIRRSEFNDLLAERANAEVISV